MTPEELAIRATIHLVENLGAHILLTQVVTKLSEAQDRLSDWVDLEHPEPWVKP